MSVPAWAASSYRSALLFVVFALVTPQSALAQAASTEASAGASTVSSTATSTSADGKASLADIETDTQSDTPAQDDSTSGKLAWDLTHRRYTTWDGSTGGLFLIDGTTGEPSALRFQLGIDTFSGDDFLYDGDHVEQDGQTLVASWTATRIFEVYAALENRMSAISVPEARSLDSTGDGTVGFKIAWKPAPIIGLGFDARAMFANQVGGGGSLLESTSMNLRSAFTLDLQGLDEPVPFLTRVNVGYTFDNTQKVVEDIEAARYENLNDPKDDEDDETRHLVDRFERYALGVNRFDRLTIGAGVEVPVEVAERFFLHPMAEWQMGIGVNRQDYDCPHVTNAGEVGTPESTIDTCYERAPGGSLPMTLALGVRVVPPLRGISAVLGVELGLSGTSTFARELTPVSPYRVLFAFSYDYDARPAEKVIVPAPAAAPAPAPVITGRIQGRVTGSDGSPIDSAIVAFVAHDVSAVATSSDGRFVSEAFPPGEVQLEASHPDYETGRCAAVIPEGGGNVEASCELTPKPSTAKLTGRVLDVFGAPQSGASVSLQGPTSGSATTDMRGTFEIAGVTSGEYTVRVDAPGHFTKLMKTTVGEDSQSQLEIAVLARPASPTVSLSGNGIPRA